MRTLPRSTSFVASGTEDLAYDRTPGRRRGYGVDGDVEMDTVEIYIS